MRLAVLCAIGVAGCFVPSPHPGGECAPGGLCPAPLECSPASNTCEVPGQAPDAGCAVAPELCDGIDQDCDLAIDEDFPTLGDACIAGVGACQAAGTYQCNSGGTDVTCQATVGGPAAEICADGIDQDCDMVDPPCPANDGPGGAIDISAGGSFTGELAVARDDDSGGTCGAAGGRDLYYTFTLGAPEVVYFDSFGSDFDVVIRAYGGACDDPNAALIACIDDSCGAQAQDADSLAAGTYCVVIDQTLGAGETSGHVDLRLIRGGRPGIALPDVMGTMVGTTVGGANLTVPICEGDSTTAPDVGYFFMVCPGAMVTVSADTCENTPYDSWLSIREGDGTTGAELACLDDLCGDDTMISTAIASPGLYWLLVDGWSDMAGTYEMDYSIQ